MKKKKILVLTPDTPDPSYIESILSPLSFLSHEYSLHPLDSLSIMDDVSNSEFYQQWQNKLAPLLPEYDALFGFSFGGVILQQSFPILTNLHKPIILFSTPAFADHHLAQKLEKVIALCEQNRVDDAMHVLYHYVYYPNPPPKFTHQIHDYETAAKRVIYGLTRVLTTDSSELLNTVSVTHLHLIGEQSNLVNKNNIISAKGGTLVSIPDAGMRILRDQPEQCQHLISRFLNNERNR